MKPYKLDLSQFGEKVRDKIDFTISNVSDQDIDISMISFAHDYFDVDFPATIGSGKTVKGTLKLKEFSLDKNFEKSFTLETNDSEKSRFTVPVKRQMRNSQAAKTSHAKSGH